MTETGDFFSHMLDSTHTYGDTETLVLYRDRDGGEWHPTPGPLSVEAQHVVRRRVTTTYPDGTMSQGWDTLTRETTPYTHEDDQG